MSDEVSRNVERLDRLFMQVGGINAEIAVVKQQVARIIAEDVPGSSEDARNRVVAMEEMVNRLHGMTTRGFERLEEAMRTLEKDTTVVIDRLDRHHERITALEDCYTAPEKGEADPKQALYDQILEGIHKHHPNEQGEAQAKQYASRLTNALWEAKLRSPAKIAACTDKRLESVKGVGRRWGAKVLRATFPRAL